MHLPSQSQIWKEKREKLMRYRKMRETPLGYVPNSPQHPPHERHMKRLTDKMPITFLSENDLRQVSNQFAQYVYSKRATMSRHTKNRYKAYMNLAKTQRSATPSNTHSKPAKRPRTARANRTRKSPSMRRANTAARSRSAMHRDSVESGRSLKLHTIEVADEWYDSEQYSVESRKTSMSLSRPQSALTEHRASARTIDQLPAQSLAPNTAPLQTPPTSLHRTKTHKPKRPRPHTASAAPHRPPSLHSSSKRRPHSSRTNHKSPRNILTKNHLIDNLETSQNVSFNAQDLSSSMRRRFYDDQIRLQEARRRTNSRNLSARQVHADSQLHQSRELMRSTLEKSFIDSMRRPSDNQVVISPVRTHEPHPHDEDDELYYGSKELSDKIKSGKWKSHEPPPLPSYDSNNQHQDSDEKERLQHAKAPAKKDAATFRKEYHEHFSALGTDFNKPVDITSFGEESIVDLRMLEREMSFEEIKQMLYDLYMEMQVPPTLVDEIIDLYFANDLPGSRRVLLSEINSLILIRSGLLRIIEEVKKFKHQELLLQQSAGKVKSSELHRRENQLRESAHILLDRIRKWQDQSSHYYKWKEVLYHGENLVLNLSKL